MMPEDLGSVPRDQARDERRQTNRKRRILGSDVPYKRAICNKGLLYELIFEHMIESASLPAGIDGWERVAGRNIKVRGLENFYILDPKGQDLGLD